MRRIGPKGLIALAYISRNAGCSKWDVARRVAKYGSRGARPSYGVVMALLIALLVLLSGCFDVQVLCPSGSETPYIEFAAEYWYNRGYAVVVSQEGVGCTVRTRIAKTWFDGGAWHDDALAIHHLPTPISSHTIQSEIRLGAKAWKQATEMERLFIATHEVGHTWLTHSEGGVMMKRLPETEREMADILTQE